MIQQRPPEEFDSTVQISDYTLVEKLGDAALLGNWFAFLKADWLARSGMDKILAVSGLAQPAPKHAILFRGEEMALPGATLSPKTLPQSRLRSLTSDKALYRANTDTVRLLIASPQQPGATLKLQLRLSGNNYADYAVTLDEFGLSLWSMPGLPEGEYEASVEEGDPCRFEVAEYRLAPLNAELSEQRLSGDTLRYTLTVTSFGQPYTGPVEVELQERGQRVGSREKLVCNRAGQCRGVVKLSGTGPYILNLFAGERSATVALKGSEQERRETLTISELGDIREISLLPLPSSNLCRGIYIARGGSNIEPFLVRRVVGSEIEITPRLYTEMLRVVVVNPARNTREEHLFEQLAADQSLRLPIPSPYAVVLLGAFVEDKAWEGWCAVLRPSELQLQCEAPKEARPGARINIRLKTGLADHAVPVQLIVKDARLIAPADPQVEFAACIKKNLTAWREQSRTGEVEKQLAQVTPGDFYRMRAGGPVMRRVGGIAPMAMASALPPPMVPMPTTAFAPAASSSQAAPLFLHEQSRAQTTQTIAPTTTLTRVRMQFPEVVYNNIVKVTGEAKVEVRLGDSLTRYSIEAFALLPETMDWQRVETSLEAVQPVYGELTVSPFVLPGDPVMGSLDVGAASGGAIVEVRHDDEILPLFYADGNPVTPGLPIPSGSTLRFPVRPGAITAIVRDARKGGQDVSERYVTEPGKLRHISRRLRLLTPGDEVTAREPRVLELRPLPGLERPFQFFVEGAVKYPFGCIEQTSCKLLAMYTGYITNQENAEVARDYEAAILVWHKRLKSMYLPGRGFCFYPPEEGGARKPDTHYAPRGVKHLLNLPAGKRSGLKNQALSDLLDDISTMVKDAAAYYKIGMEPQEITDCHAAYQVLVHSTDQQKRAAAAHFVRSRLREHDRQTYVEAPADQSSYRLGGMAVSTREETAYAAAALLAAKESADLPRAIAATNYLTAQLNEEGRLYSTVDTAACLALLLGLRESGIVTTGENGRVQINEQEMSLATALAYSEKVETVRCIEGVIAVQVTSEVIEDWTTFKNTIPVEIRLEQEGHAQKRFKSGDALDLVIRVPRYEPGLIAHICLPDALARVVGGGQVKRFSLDFCEKNELRIPLAAVGSTVLPPARDAETERSLLRWLGVHTRKDDARHTQHWAVIVRNMFKEEQVGNPGLLEVIVE